MTTIYRRRSLIVQLLFLSMAAVTLPALLISFVYQSISSHALLSSIQQQQTELARRIAEQVDSDVQQARRLVDLVAHQSSFSASSRVDQYEGLRNLLNADTSFQETMLVSSSGMEMLKVSQVPGATRLVKRSEDIRVPYIGQPFFSGNRSPTILLSAPLHSFANPRRTGAVMAKMSFTRLGALLKQATIGPHGIAFIVDSKGTLLAHPDENLVFAHTYWASRPVVSAWLTNPGESTGLVEDRDETGEGLLSIAYPIPLLKSAVVIQQRKSDIYKPLAQMQHQFLLWTCLSVLVFLAIALAVAWRILKPLRQLKAAVEDVAKGKRDIHLNIHTHDELEELARTFENMTKSLDELERMRRNLISMVVHDLKMPLSTILPSLESLLAGDVGDLSKDQANFIQMARRSGQEMLMLIQNLLDVAKMEEGKLTLTRELFAPADWARSVVSNFKPLAESAKKKLLITVGGGLGPVMGDSALLSRVLGNLVSNALRHTSPVVGEVHVSLYRDGTHLAVEVRDNGEGIAAEDQKRIFERFVQGENQKANLQSGTGLGLTFCKIMVEAHGGHISLFSQPNEGSVFTFRLPLAQEPQEIVSGLQPAEPNPA